MKIFASNIEITPNTIFRRSSDLLFNEIDGEVIMLSIENSEYYGMDKVASRIWELLDKPLNLKELIARLVIEYDISEQQCTKDTLDFLKKLIDKKLLICD
jgi:hypothetical protein